jgi:hypothetical protein
MPLAPEQAAALRAEDRLSRRTLGEREAHLGFTGNCTKCVCERVGEEGSKLQNTHIFVLGGVSLGGPSF